MRPGNRSALRWLPGARADKDDITAAKCRLRLTEQTYVDFSKEMGLRQKRERLRVARETVENMSKSDVIISESAKEETDEHFVGKIDRNIYKCITEDIRTDEVVITDNQIKHILDRHPGALKKAIEDMRSVIENPDYIIADEKHKNTGLAIKNVESEMGYLHLVLRVCTSEDEPGYKNSVISCWEISERRLQNHLRNKNVLYKRE